MFTFGSALVALGVGPVIAVLVGREFADLNVERNTALAGSYVAGAVGYFAFAVLTLIGVSIAGGSGGAGGDFGGGLGGSVQLGDVFVPLILGALVVGVAGVAGTYFERNY